MATTHHFVGRKPHAAKLGPAATTEPIGALSSHEKRVLNLQRRSAGRTHMLADRPQQTPPPSWVLDELADIATAGLGRNANTYDANGNAVLAYGKRTRRTLTRLCPACHLVLPLTGTCC